MKVELRRALCTGYERLSAWAEMLDRINVFPVPDGDTGRNLVLSLAALRSLDLTDEQVAHRLLLSARGNSGNISVAFVRELLQNACMDELRQALVRAAAAARGAVAQPQPGTMLTVFDALAAGWPAACDASCVEVLLCQLEQTVCETKDQLEALRKADVVDSGALGMLVFLDGFLRDLFGVETSSRISERFRHLARFGRQRFGQPANHGCCIDVVLRADPTLCDVEERLNKVGHEVVVLREQDFLKVHLHADDPERAREALASLGSIVSWAWDDLAEQTSAKTPELRPSAVHIMTDAAGSVSRADAESLGVTLLDSYLNLSAVSVPETRLAPEELYRAMQQGTIVSTSQASVFERQQHYERAVSLHDAVVYLCVGSVYTGNYEVATRWKQQHEHGHRCVVIDSGAASGRLAVVVWATARRAWQASGVQEVARFAEQALERAEEYIFLDKLEYLARGGRVSKAKSMFSDVLGLAPVISPRPEGAQKVALLRKMEDRIVFAMDRVGKALERSKGRGLVLAEYSNNQSWVETHVADRLRQRWSDAEVLVRPFSLTSGAHMGPGTWAVAVLPDGESYA